MTDRLERFEAELSAMRPRSPSTELLERIESSLATVKSRPRSDRLLLAAMTAGAVAACVIAAMLLSQPWTSLPSAAPLNATIQGPRLGDSQQVFVRADAPWLDPLK